MREPGLPVVIVSGSVREALFAQPLVAALDCAWVFAPVEGLGVLRLPTVAGGFAVSSGPGLVRAWLRLRGLSARLVVAPPPISPGSATLAYLSGIAERVTIAQPKDWWATHRIRVPADAHPVDAIRQLASFTRMDHRLPGGPQIVPATASQERLGARLLAAGIGSADLVLTVIPGRGNWIRHASAPRWPADRFAVLANRLGPDHVVLVRGAGDAGAVRDVRAGLPARSTTVDLPAITAEELAALARRSVGVIGHDGDALHVAAAAGGRTVALLGPGDLAPYGSDGVVVRVDALHAVPALAVLEVVRRHLEVSAHAWG